MPPAPRVITRDTFGALFEPVTPGVSHEVICYRGSHELDPAHTDAALRRHAAMGWQRVLAMARSRRILVSNNYDPLAHVPDPNDRFQVFAYTRGVEIFVEIYDTAAGTGLTIPMLDAIKVAGHINQQLFYAVEAFFKRAQDGTVPEFERLISEWGPHGEGTAEQN